MRRRDLMLLLGGTMIAPRALRAQQRRIPVIGYLASSTPATNAPLLPAFLQGLSETGHVEGENVAIEYRWAEDRFDRLPALAAELIAGNVDLIMSAGGITGALAAKNATSTKPIVFITGDDPVERGLVASLARPGGNLTGISFLTRGLMPKRLELLSELVPRVKLVALLVNPNNASAERVIRAVREAAAVKGLALQLLKAGTEEEIGAALNFRDQRSLARCSSPPTRSYSAGATSSSRWRHTTPSRRFTSAGNSSRRVA